MLNIRFHFIFLKMCNSAAGKVKEFISYASDTSQTVQLPASQMCTYIAHLLEVIPAADRIFSEIFTETVDLEGIWESQGHVRC